MTGEVIADRDVDIDLGRLFRAVWDRRMRVLMATVAVTAITFVGVSLIKPDYRSEAKILIEMRGQDYSKTDNANAASGQVIDEPGIASQVQIFRSADLIKQVARDMKLYELPEFDKTAKPSMLSNLLVGFGLAKNPLDMQPEDRVLAAFQEKLDVYQAEKSRVIGIQFTSKDPKLAAAIPNKMAEVYLALQSGAKLDTNSEASRWLEPEIANLREKVSDAEAKVAAYRANNDILPTGDNKSNFADKQLNDISTELARVRTDRATAEARAASVKSALQSGRPVDTLQDVVGSQMIQRLKESESTIQSTMADLSTTLLDGHPRLKALRSQLAGIRAQIEVETKKILGSLENEANVGRLREQQLLQQLNSLKADSARAGEQEVGLAALEREAASQRQLLETYLARYRAATSITGSDSTPADARIISQAVEPDKVYFPKVIPITIVAAAGTLVFSSIIILLMELFSGRALRPSSAVVPARKVIAVIDPEKTVVVKDVPLVEPVAASAARVVEQPVVKPSPAAAKPGLLSANPAASIEMEEQAEPDIEALDDSDFSIGSVCRHLVNSHAKLAVCVSPSGDNGSAATVALSRRVSSHGVRTILLDLTGTGYPTELMLSGLEGLGITDLLAGTASFGDCIHNDGFSAAHIVPLGTADPAIAMRGLDRLGMIVDALSQAYDTVIIECGPVDAAALKRLLRNPGAEIVLSAPLDAVIDIPALMEQFLEAGYEEIILMAASSPTDPNSGRKAA